MTTNTEINQLENLHLQIDAIFQPLIDFKYSHKFLWSGRFFGFFIILGLLNGNPSKTAQTVLGILFLILIVYIFKKALEDITEGEEYIKLKQIKELQIDKLKQSIGIKGDGKVLGNINQLINIKENLIK